MDEDEINDYPEDGDSDFNVPSSMPSMASAYGGHHCTAPSTEVHIKAIWKPWVAFCAQIGRAPFTTDLGEPTTGLCLYVAKHCSSLPPCQKDRLERLCTPPDLHEMIHINIDYSLINEFLSFQAARHEMTASNLKKTSTFLKAHLQAEYRVLQNQLSARTATNFSIECAVDKITGISSLSRYSQVMKSVKKRKAEQDKELGIDIQADKERHISDAQRIELIEEAFFPSSSNHLHEISRLCFIAQINKAFQIVKRGEALRAHTFGMCYVQEYRLGPDGKLKTAFVMSNKGKENGVGRRTCTGYVPHYQPLFDALGSDGLLFLYRFGGEKSHYSRGEVVPDLLDPEILLGHHIYPSVCGGGMVPITAPVDQVTWSKSTRNAGPPAALFD